MKAKSAVCRRTTEGHVLYFPEHYQAKQKQDPCSSGKADQNYKSGNEMLIHDCTYLPLDYFKFKFFCYRNCHWILSVKPEWKHKNENNRHLRSLITHDIPMTCLYPVLGSVTSIAGQFRKGHFAGKPFAASRNVVCFLRLHKFLGKEFLLKNEA